MIQVQFTHFPGYEPFTVERGWRHLPTPWRTMTDDAVLDLGNSDDDPIMEMIDWAIDNHPAIFGLIFDNREYEDANDLSVSLAGDIITLAEEVIDGKDCTPGDGGAWSDRYRDISLADGVTVRVAYFVR